MFSSSTKTIHKKTILLSDPEKTAQAMREALIKLHSKVMEIDTEYCIYQDQKDFTQSHADENQLKECQTLFASDFNDFKTKLNEAIRAFNQYQNDYKFQLAILGPQHRIQQELKNIAASLNQFKALYNKDKALYTSIQLEATANTNQVASNSSVDQGNTETQTSSLNALKR